MPVENLDEVRTWLTENKDTEEVKGFFTEIAPTPEAPEITAANVLPFLETPEGKALIEPRIDQRVTSAVQTHDVKTQEANEQKVKATIAAEMLKLNPEETVEMKEIRELKEQVNAVTTKSEKDTLMRQVVEAVAAKELPSWFADFIVNPIGTPEEGTLVAERLRTFLSEHDTETTNKLMASGFKPGAGSEKEPKVDVAGLSPDEILQMEIAGTLDDAMAT